VDRVNVLKSTGSKILDDSVVATFQQWQAKPRMIRRAVFPVEFHRM
jgi:TonB family protein